MISPPQVEQVIQILQSKSSLVSERSQQLLLENLTKISHLRHLLEDCQDSELKSKFFKAIQHRHFQKGQIMMHKGEKCDGVHIFLNGQVSLWQQKSYAEISLEIDLNK